MAVRIVAPSQNVGVIVPYRTEIYVAWKTAFNYTIDIFDKPISLELPGYSLNLSDDRLAQIQSYLFRLPTSFAFVIRPFTPVDVNISLDLFADSQEEAILYLRKFSAILHRILPHYRTNFLSDLLRLAGAEGITILLANDVNFPALQKNEIYRPNFEFRVFLTGRITSTSRDPYGILLLTNVEE